MSRAPIPPHDKVYNESEVVSMLAGTYWSDSEDEDKPGGKKIASLSDDDNNDQAGDGEINKLHHARLKFKV